MLTSPRVLVSPPCVVGNRAALRELLAAFADEFEIVIAFFAGRRAEEKAGRIRQAIFKDRALKLIDMREFSRVSLGGVWLIGSMIGSSAARLS